MNVKPAGKPKCASFFSFSGQSLRLYLREDSPMDVRNAIRTKRAVRQYSEQPITEVDMRAILDAGRRSQSSRNSQPWEFVVVRNREMLSKIAQTRENIRHLAGAAFAVIIVGSEDSLWVHFDLGQTAAYMQLAACELGIGSCVLAIHEPGQVKGFLNIPSDRSLFVALAFGYPSADFAPAKRGGRKPLEEVAHWDKW
jgi:nitroreductase